MKEEDFTSGHPTARARTRVVLVAKIYADLFFAYYYCIPSAIYTLTCPSNCFRLSMNKARGAACGVVRCVALQCISRRRVPRAD